MRGPRGGAWRRSPRIHHAAASGDISRPFLSPNFSSFPGAAAAHRRDSDISSLGSSRLSSVSTRPPSSTLSTRPPSSVSADTTSHLRAVNSYLASLSPPLHLKPPFPPSSSVAEAIRAIFAQLEFPNPIADLPRDLPPLLASLHCPIKLTKSALKAPSTPHSWPSVLSVLHWLVQLALVADHITCSPASPEPSDVDVNSYITRSYSLFLAGDDSAVADLEAEFLEKLTSHAASAAKDVEALEAEVALYKARIRDRAVKPTRLEAVEAERGVLLEDWDKFRSVVENYAGMIEGKREKVRERERELERREVEKRRLDEVNEELRERIRRQLVSARDVERMARELGVVEREIAEREARRNEMEEKLLLLDYELEKKFGEIEVMVEQSNHVIRK